MPEWALPQRQMCKGCGNQVKERTVNKVHYTAPALAKRGVELYGLELCADCQIERAKASQTARKEAGKVPA